MSEPSATLTPPSERELSVVTVHFPAGHHLAAIPQMIVGSLEMSLEHELVDLIQLRQTIHELVCHLDRTAPSSSDLTVEVRATRNELVVVLGAEMPSTAGAIDSWLLNEAEQQFDAVEVELLGGQVTVTLRSSSDV